jgi:hypothetical protein
VTAKPPLFLTDSLPALSQDLCELDGHAPDDSNRYWHCTEPGAVDVEGVLMCLRHAGQLGYGPEQAEYGYDPDDGHNPTPEIRTEEAGQ